MRGASAQPDESEPRAATDPGADPEVIEISDPAPAESAWSVLLIFDRMAGRTIGKPDST